MAYSACITIRGTAVPSLEQRISNATTTEFVSRRELFVWSFRYQAPISYGSYTRFLETNTIGTLS